MRRTMLTLTALALFVAGCGGGTPLAEETVTDVDATPTPAGTTPDAATPTDDTSEAATGTEEAPSPPFTANTADDTSEGSGDPVTVSDVRVESEADFDRVVFEIAGDGTPGWQVGYVDEAIEQGRGNTVELEGDAQLQVLVTNTGYPFDTGEEEYDGPDRIDGAEVVTEVVFQGVYEGQTQAFVGTTAEQPFRAQLDDDGNVVVEVWHTDVAG